LLNIHGRWETREEDDKCIRWTKDVFDAVKPYSTGSVYVNFISQEGEGRVQDAYPELWERLVNLKNKYDPENFFQMNQNIKPKSGQ
jgi:FAD/FMN-containing dehydrogenase